MEKRLLILFLFTLLLEIGYTKRYNNEKIDSLFLELQLHPNNKKKVEKLIWLFNESRKGTYYNINIIKQAIAISSEIYYLDGLGKALLYKGISERKKYKYYKSTESLKRGLNYLEKSTDTLTQIKCLNALGTTYRKLNMEAEAFKSYFKAYELASKVNNTVSKAICMNGIGNIFTDINKHKIALHYFRKGLDFEKINKNDRGIEYDLANIGESHLYLGNYDSARIYIDKALQYAKKRKKMNRAGPEFSLLGLLHQKEKKYTISNEFYDKAINLFIASKNYRYLSNALINTGINLIHLKKEKKGLDNIRTGIRYATQIGSKENILLGNNALINYYTQKRDFKRAFTIQKLAMNIKDSILNDASQKSIISSQIAQQSIEKDEKIKQLSHEKQKSSIEAKKNRNRLIYSIILGLLAFTSTLSIYLIYRRNTESRLENMQTELQHYIEQLKGHRKFSSEKKITLKEQLSDFDLSDRELSVLRLLVKGKTNKKISEELYISINTVKSHIKSIYGKMDVKNRVQVVQKIKGDENT